MILGTQNYINPIINGHETLLLVYLLLFLQLTLRNRKRMSTQTASIVNITEPALAEFKRLMVDKQVPVGNGLRVGVKGGGCAGFSYILGFDNPTDQDEKYELDGITVLVNRAHAMYLQGIEIDYHNGLDARGFIFNNPNASETCGCGTSFAS